VIDEGGRAEKAGGPISTQPPRSMSSRRCCLPRVNVRLRGIIVHEPGTAVSPVVPDAGNTVGIWVRIIERAVRDPQGFDFFTFRSEKLAHRCQGREPPKKSLRLCFGARCSVHAAASLVIQFNASKCSLNVSTDSIDPSGHSA
jgi:hypothetical protein